VDTIPIQDLVDQAKKRTIDSITNALVAKFLALTGPLSGFLGWVASWGLKPLVRYFVGIVVDQADKTLFNFNMDVITADQAADYRRAEASIIMAKKKGEMLTDAEWKELENEADAAFSRLVSFTA